jgi:pyruvate, water dikinase
MNTFTITGKGGGKRDAVVTGKARIVHDVSGLNKVEAGDILITAMTDVDFVPAMERAGAVVTDFGGVICHAAIICAELGIPFVVGTISGTSTIMNGVLVTVDVAKGEVRSADGIAV